jgi:hypothetical protein
MELDLGESLPAWPSPTVFHGDLYLEITLDRVRLLHREAKQRLLTNPLHCTVEFLSHRIDALGQLSAAGIEIFRESIAGVKAMAQPCAPFEHPSLGFQHRLRKSMKDPENDVILLNLVEPEALGLGSPVDFIFVNHPRSRTFT